MAMTDNTIPVAWDETVDVIIIGSGFAGLAAAYEASKQADSVLVLEKMAYSGGNSRIAGGGYCCWDSKLKLREKLGLGEDSWELHAADTLACGRGYNDPVLVEVLAKEAPAGLDLMVDAGIPFRESLPRIGGHSAYRSYQIACTGAETMQKLEDCCLAAPGTHLRCNAQVEAIIRQSPAMSPEAGQNASATSPETVWDTSATEPGEAGRSTSATGPGRAGWDTSAAASEAGWDTSDAAPGEGWDTSDAGLSQNCPKGDFGTLPRRACHTRPTPETLPSPVLGVQVTEGPKDQKRTRFIRATRAVIIASGGFGNDVALRCAHKPSLTDAYSCTNHKGATGEVIRFAQSVGADVLHMEFVQLYPCASPKNGGIDQAAFLCYSGTGYGLIYVDGQGARFVNELASREEVSDAQMACDSKPTYSILNDGIFQKLGVGEGDVQAMVASGRAVKADSLEALAAAMGFNGATFAKAVADHDQAIATGQDPAFHTPVTGQMVPLSQGPFYAIAQWPSVHYCMGGLRIDADAHVIDIFGNPIPGLYAAGEVCGGVHGIDRLGGNGIAECMVFGRIAGQLR